MRVQRVNAPKFFFKKITRPEVLQNVRERLPIHIRDMDDFCERVHTKCPYIELSEIKSIIKETFEAMRAVIILGESLSIRGLFSRFFLRFRLTRSRAAATLKVGIRASHRVKYHKTDTKRFKHVDS